MKCQYCAGEGGAEYAVRPDADGEWTERVSCRGCMEFRLINRIIREQTDKTQALQDLGGRISERLANGKTHSDEKATSAKSSRQPEPTPQLTFLDRLPKG